MLDIILLLGDPLVVAKLIYSPSHLSLSFAVVPQKLEFVDCNLPRDFRNTSPRLFLLFRSFVLNFFLFRSPPLFHPALWQPSEKSELIAITTEKAAYIVYTKKKLL
jgi:hypothetical protein